MSTRITAEEASRRWSSASGAQSSHHGFTFGGGMPADIQYPAALKLQEPYHPAQGGIHYIGVENVGSEMPCSKYRLRWSKELHDKFVSAVNQLGGASNATPKTIWNIMRVKDLTLFQIKSHLQKYRLGNISRRLLTKDAVPAVDENKSLDMETCHGSCDDNAGDETSEAPKYENLNHLVEPRTSVKNSAMIENPPLSPSIPTSNKHDDLHNFPEWSGLLDSSLNSHGCSSYILTFGNFFEDLPKI